METLQIHAGLKTYPVHLGAGLRHQTWDLIKAVTPDLSKVMIVTDDQIAPLYLEEVVNSFHKEEIHVDTFIISAGEEYKSFDKYYEIQTAALEHGLDRKSAFVALGGGVIGDLVGFVASTFLRGVTFIQVPTTLLAHDSSVGGKVAINHPLGKNLIGSFYQPDAVIYDIETFRSLPAREWRSGFAELIKHALISDLTFYEELMEEVTSLPVLGEQERFIEFVKRGIAVKEAIVREDEKESGVRAHLNFGHTLGHAIEAALGYGQLSHGEAVGIGMIFAMKTSEDHYGVKLPINPLVEWMTKLGMPTEIPPTLTWEKLLEHMKKDKKTYNQSIRMVLMREVGHVETVAIDEALLIQRLKSEVKGATKW